MSHKGNDNFKEAINEKKVEDFYEAVTPSRCYEPYDSTDKAEVQWRLANCFGVKPKAQPKPAPVTALPPNTDEDYWREREADSARLKEVYAEAQRYRDL